MKKIVNILFFVTILSGSAIAGKTHDVLNEMIGSGQFFGVSYLASTEEKRIGKIAAAILTPATFGFESTSVSVGLSKVNAALKDVISKHTNSELVVNAAPVMVDFICALGAKVLGFKEVATLLGSKAGYALSDVSLSLAGSNAGAALLMFKCGRLAEHSGLQYGLVRILYENAGALMGDAVYSALSLHFGYFVANKIAHACIALLLASLHVAAGGETTLAITSGFIFSSYFALATQ